MSFIVISYYRQLPTVPLFGQQAGTPGEQGKYGLTRQAGQARLRTELKIERDGDGGCGRDWLGLTVLFKELKYAGSFVYSLNSLILPAWTDHMLHSLSTQLCTIHRAPVITRHYKTIPRQTQNQKNRILYYWT